jgi:type I restriction enzyme S subunit
MHMNLAGDRERELREVVVLDEDAVPVNSGEEYPQVGIKGFGAGLFKKPATKGTDTTYKTFNRLYPGALVLSQVKGWEGAIAVAGDDLAGWFVSPEYRTFRCIAGETSPDYLSALVRTAWFWTRLQTATRGVGARRERTRPEQFLSIKIPMPDLDLQKSAVAVFKRLNPLKGLQTQTAAELDALLPAILDRAFKGKL